MKLSWHLHQDVSSTEVKWHKWFWCIKPWPEPSRYSIILNINISSTLDKHMNELLIKGMSIAQLNVKETSFQIDLQLGLFQALQKLSNCWDSLKYTQSSDNKLLGIWFIKDQPGPSNPVGRLLKRKSFQVSTTDKLQTSMDCWMKCYTNAK